MILAAALLLAAPAVQDTPEEIVVTAKLQTIDVRLQLDRRKRVRSCGIARGTGDAAFDRAACDATIACYRSGARTAAPMRACIRPRLVAFARAQAAQQD
jgi:hypothetical protein